MTCKYFTETLLLFTCTIISSGTLQAQQNDSLLQKRIQYQQYVFVPLSLSSSTGTVPLSSREFQLRVTYDSVIAVLPFFGSSYSPKFGRSDDDEIRFISTDFEYSAVAKKKGKWEISIISKDVKGIRIFLVVFNNGNAHMDVTSPGRETMLFKGYVW